MAKTEPEPSDKQLELLRYLIAHVEEHGYQPTQAEMAREFGVTKTAVRNRLKELSRRGLVEIYVGDKSKERAIRMKNVKFKAYLFEPKPEPGEDHKT